MIERNHNNGARRERRKERDNKRIAGNAARLKLRSRKDERAELATALNPIKLYHVLLRLTSIIFKGVVDIGKMGRPTENPRTEKVGFRLSKKEIEDIKKCADKMQTQRVNAVVAGINLLKELLEIKD